MKERIENRRDGRRGRRRKQLLNDLKEVRRYWKFKNGALHVTLWRRGFGCLARWPA
jgi:hypothetical protein